MLARIQAEDLAARDPSPAGRRWPSGRMREGGTLLLTISIRRRTVTFVLGRLRVDQRVRRHPKSVFAEHFHFLGKMFGLKETDLIESIRTLSHVAYFTTLSDSSL